MDKIKIVGILNINNDSFYDGGHYVNLDKAIIKAVSMIKEGADIIEVGGFSTKPGSLVPDLDIELSRIIPVIKILNKLNIPISVDTTRSGIVKELIKFKNVTYINDTSGLLDTSIIDIIKPTKINYVLMHIKGHYSDINYNINTVYEDGVLNEILHFFDKKIKLIEKKGFKNIIIDPGFFFGKNPDQNIQIIKGISKLKKFKYPLFVALSRKSHILGINGAKSNLSLIETCILNFQCLLGGATYLRVHDISEARHTLKLYELFSHNN